MAANVEALAKKGIYSTSLNDRYKSLINNKRFNNIRQPPFLPMQCYKPFLMSDYAIQ